MSDGTANNTPRRQPDRGQEPPPRLDGGQGLPPRPDRGQEPPPRPDRGQEPPPRLDGGQGLPRVYLAGPDVFLPDPLAQAEAKKAVLARYHLDGQFPLDNQIPADAVARHGGQIGLAIAEANETLMSSCDTIIANMTPYHGRVSMDVGTAFEIGYMRAQGKPVFGYSNDERPFFDRVRDEYYQGQVREGLDSAGRPQVIGADGNSIENFGLSENLMMPGAIAMSGGRYVAAPPAQPAAYHRDLGAFAQVARAVAEHYYGPSAVQAMEAAQAAPSQATRPERGWTRSLGADGTGSPPLARTPAAPTAAAPRRAGP